jgi:fructose-1,6-bisphosphatase I/sedoheptulose-1,7-bisphosphatase
MAVHPEALHQRMGFIFGSRHEVERIEGYHREEPSARYDAPLFGKRGLFSPEAE